MGDALRRCGRMAATLALGTLGALAASFAGLPLPFLLGPLAIAAVATVSGAPVLTLPYGREIGQVIVGLSIGFRFVPEVATATLRLLPMMAVATLLVIAATFVAAFVMERLGGIDRNTAFFATAAAGLAEMAVVAQQKGADADAVAIVHFIRVVFIVTMVPVLVTLFGEAGHVAAPGPTRGTEAALLLALFVASVCCALLARPLRMPNTWLLVPAFLGALTVASGIGGLAVPRTLLGLAQILIGTWIGCRFRREIVTRLPRVSLAAVATTMLLLACSAAIALFVSRVTGLPFSTSLLSVAPAGITEMVLTATAMHFDAATVTGFQIMRIAVVMTTIPLVFRLFSQFPHSKHNKQC